MGDLLGRSGEAIELQSLYRCQDKLLAHKAALFSFLRERWQDPVLGGIRSAALRPDQHVFRVRPAGEREMVLRLQPGQASGLRAGNCRSGGNAGGPAAGLRSDGGKYQRQGHAEKVSGKDLTAIRAGEADLGHGLRHSHRGGSERNTGGPVAGGVSGGDAAGSAEQTG